jgi:hypothetical protein
MFISVIVLGDSHLRQLQSVGAKSLYTMLLYFTILSTKETIMKQQTNTKESYWWGDGGSMWIAVDLMQTTDTIR